MSCSLSLLALGVAWAAPSDAAAAGRPLTATLTGASEVPGPGDPDGSGEFFVTLNPGQREVCYQLNVSGIEPARAAHIHVAPVGVAGPVIIPLVPPTGGSSSACVSASRDLIKAIIRNPGAYYVNVHNSTFPAGAIRGQLTRQPATTGRRRGGS